MGLTRDNTIRREKARRCSSISAKFPVPVARSVVPPGIDHWWYDQTKEFRSKLFDQTETVRLRLSNSLAAAPLVVAVVAFGCSLGLEQMKRKS